MAQLFPQPLPGLTTWAEPETAVYLRENCSGQTVQVGVYDPSLPGTENKMTLCGDGFVSLGVPALLRCAESDSEWVSVDEIGYLENTSPEFRDALQVVMERKHLAGVVRKQKIPFLRELCCRKDVFLVDLDAPFGSIGCVIMASGLGKRFGGNKLMADFHGRPLISKILDATEGIFSRRVVVTRHEEVAQLCKVRDIPAILHDRPHRSDTVRLGMEAMEGVERCMFCPGDQPLLRTDTIAALALASANEPGFIWRTSCDGVPGAPVVFPLWAAPELRSLPEGNGGGAVIKKYPKRLRTVNVWDKYELNDVDSPEDLVRLLER